MLKRLTGAVGLSVVAFTVFLFSTIASDEKAMGPEERQDASQQPRFPAPTKLASAASEPLEQSDLWAQVQESIRKSEYDIRLSPSADATDTTLSAVNPASNVRIKFDKKGISVRPCELAGANSRISDVVQHVDGQPASQEHDRSFTFALTGVGSGELAPLPKSEPVLGEQSVEYASTGLLVSYTNSDKGICEKVTIDAPVSDSETVVLENTFSEGTQISWSSPLGVGGIRDAHGLLPVALRGISASDASGKVLPTTVSGEDNVLTTVVDTSDAVYPVVAEKFLTGGGSNPWMFDGNQAGAHLGSKITGAGDVNGDGCDDVLVVASGYDGGNWSSEPNTGIVLLFYGYTYGLSPYPAWSVEGARRSVNLGAACSAGDVNNDGYDDIIVGAGSLDQVYVYLGSGVGLSNTPDTTITSIAGTKFGASISSAGDVNKDGYDDILVGAYLESDKGSVRLFLGSATGVDATADWIAFGPSDGMQFGYSVSDAGDVNNDGYADVIIGAPQLTSGETREGGAYLYKGNASGLLGSASWVTHGNQVNGYWGYSVSDAGDTNGDGFDDVIVGSPGYTNGQANEGRIAIYLGNATALSLAVDVHAESDEAGAQYGNSVSSAGDLNGDGYSEVIVGSIDSSHGESGEGRVYLFYGSSNKSEYKWQMDSNQVDASYGAWVAGVGDVNGDGYDDFGVGATDYDGGGIDDGRAYVYFGSVTKYPADNEGWIITGEASGNRLGMALCSAGDVNNDGCHDVIVAAPYFSGSHTNEGKVFLYMGSPNGLSTAAAWSKTGGQAGALFGRSVAGDGDVNGDGWKDVAIGTPQWDNGQVDEGKVDVYLGSASGLGAGVAWTKEWDSADSRLGAAVAFAGDVNNDGYDDLLAGAPLFEEGETDEGRVQLYLGMASGVSPSAVSRLQVNQAEAHFGFAVAKAGDVNNDGFDDFIVGAPDYDHLIADEGVAYLYLGNSSGVVVANWGAAGGQAGAQMGYSVASAGDVNKDGRSDVLVGAPGFDNGNSNEGRALLYLGASVGLTPSPVWTAEGNRDSAKFGYSLAGVGDINRDTYEDVIIGAPEYGDDVSSRGMAQVFLGNSTGLAQFPAWMQEGDQDGAQYGAAVAWARDTDGDGYAEVLVGAYNYSGTPGNSIGRAYLYESRKWNDLQPTPPGIALTPSTLGTQDSAVCSITTASSSNSYRFHWVNPTTGESFVQGPSSSISSILPPAKTKKGEVWTCSVQAWNGSLLSQPPETKSVTIVNTAPSAPTASILHTSGGKHSNGTNMVAAISVEAPSYDPDVEELTDSVRYRFDWYQNGVLQPGLAQDFSASLLAQVPADELVSGDVWYCRVTPKDNESTGTVAQTASVTVVEGGVNPSLIIGNVDPDAITLGASVTFAANLFTPGPYGPTVELPAFTVTGPTGSTTKPTDYIDGSYDYLATYVPTAAGNWTMNAFWLGDDEYQACTSASHSFVVAKAQPELALRLSASSAPMDFDQLTATATLTAPVGQALLSLLANQPVRLYSRTPNKESVQEVTAVTDANGVATFTPQSFADAGIAFDEAGTWQFVAEFSGNSNLLRATSVLYDQPESPRLTIKDGAGYAVIVLGKLDQAGEGHAEHASTADSVYRAFLERGFAEEDIFYLREGAAQPAPDIFVSDTTPTKAEVQTAIQEWASAKMLATPAPLYVVFIDHGATDAFYVYSGAFDATRVISPADLDGYFDTLEGQLNPEAENQPIVFVYGACHSGSFIPVVSAENRVIITSAGADEVSHRGTTDPATGVRDGEVFVTELFRNARSGKTLKESFELASVKAEEYTATRSNDGTADLPQQALLDDNGDGAGSAHAALAFDAGYDGNQAHTLVLGFGVNAGEPASWIWASPTRVLAADDPVGTLEARASRATAPSETAWIEVKTPAYIGGELAALDLPDFQQTVPMLRFESEAGISDLSAGIHRWSDFGTAFDAPGTYKVFYYIKDVDTGRVSTHLLTTLFRAAPENQAPMPVAQIYPNNAQSVYSTTFFAWTESTDPDGDGITYRVEIAEDSGFATGLITEDGIVGTLTQISGLVDGSTYYWRVWPVDEYGASSATADVRMFTVDNNNPSLPGSIVGRVRNILTMEPVAGAAVTITPGNLQCTTGANGEYFYFQVTEGSYWVNVSATGYIGGSQMASVFAGSSASADFLLTSQKPALTVSPAAHSIGAAGGPLTFGVSNTGQGVMTYSTSIITGSEWLSIQSGATGGNSGTIHVTAAASNVTQPRTGRIRITALGIGGIAATSSPREVLIAQEAGADGVPPVITRLGSSPVNVEQHAVYIDAGATATDNVDGDITANVQAVSTVNTAAIGSYTVTYTVSDSAGNPATPVVRTVNVVAATHAEGTIGPGGGTVSRDGITVTILPGALSAPTLVTIDRAAVGDPTLPEGVLAVLNGTSFDVGPDGLTAVGGGDLATITISYPDADQNGIVDGTSIPETHLVVLHIDESTGDVTTLEGAVNTTANTVTVTTDSFSVFVVAQSEDLPGVPLMPWAVAALFLVMLVCGQLLAKRSLRSSRQ
ncbi:MAG: FG-GAP-like repeat-containing protein [Candidatus Hydrogenedentales bacterium]|jgi:hypothetical protein